MESVSDLLWLFLVGYLITFHSKLMTRLVKNMDRKDYILILGIVLWSFIAPSITFYIALMVYPPLALPILLLAVANNCAAFSVKKKHLV